MCNTKKLEETRESVYVQIYASYSLLLLPHTKNSQKTLIKLSQIYILQNEKVDYYSRHVVCYPDVVNKVIGGDDQNENEHLWC